MPISKDILLKRLSLIAALFFMLMGAYNIISDVWDGKIIWTTIVFNLFLFLPILLRNQQVHLFILGIVYTLLWGYMLFAGLYFASTSNIPINSDILLGACLLFFALASSIVLLWNGIHISTERKQQPLAHKA